MRSIYEKEFNELSKLYKPENESEKGKYRF